MGLINPSTSPFFTVKNQRIYILTHRCIHHKPSNPRMTAAFDLKEGQTISVMPNGKRHGDVRLLSREVARGYFLKYSWLFRNLSLSVLLMSLADTLKLYPIMCGRLDPDSNGLLVQIGGGTGIHFTLSSVEEAVEDVDRSMLVYHPSQESVLYHAAPLCVIRITLCRGGGVSVGLALWHALADGSSLHAFMHSWASSSHGKTLTCSAPIYDRSLFLPGQSKNDSGSVWVPSQGEAAALKAVKDVMKTDGESLMIRFSAVELTQLRRQAERSAASWISRHEALCAHLTKVLLCAWVENHPTALSSVIEISQTCNARGRPGSRVPSDYFGNAAVYTSGETFTAREALGETLGELASRFHKDLVACSGPRALELLNIAEDALRSGATNQCTYMGNLTGNVLIFNNRSKFGSYAIAFGESGPPIEVIPTHGQAGIKIFSDVNGGVRVFLKGARQALPVLRELLGDKGIEGNFWLLAPPVELLSKPEWLVKFKDLSQY